MRCSLAKISDNQRAYLMSFRYDRFQRGQSTSDITCRCESDDFCASGNLVAHFLSVEMTIILNISDGERGTRAASQLLEWQEHGMVFCNTSENLITLMKPETSTSLLINIR